MKLENNSLKYGMNSANNANNAFSNAYNQEMANQRDMQGQVTQRQKTLLEGLIAENNYKQAERNALYGANTRDGNAHYMGADKSYDEKVNDILKANVEPLATFGANVGRTMPYHIGISSDGTISNPVRSTYPFNTVSSGVVYHPDNVVKAEAEGLSPEDAYMKYHPLYVQQKGGR